MPHRDLALRIAARLTGHVPAGARRFTTGMCHYVYEVTFPDHPPLVARIGRDAAQPVLSDALLLSETLRPLGVPLPRILAHDVTATPPWLLLERLPGTDLGAVMATLSPARLATVAAHVADAQAIVARLPSAGRYGYAARPELAPHTAWSNVLLDNVDRARRRIVAAGLFDPALPLQLRDRILAARARIDTVPATPFLHDTTTRNVLVAPGGMFSGIVDVDDLCFGDPRYPAALTCAVMRAYGGPLSYVSAWRARAGWPDDDLFGLYVSVFLMDLMGEHGQLFNGNMLPSGPGSRASLLHAFQASLNGASCGE
ncbi:aminoglycoside phosphotransferase family protein [Nguyenibacter vanlangensis]|uniref:Aminoglycoside phosphotransferase family protein n=1 Tax=Nguyenibacter vanlangensis TaxID=1216886 RepID=A0ABZ3D3X0_9PROT